MKRRSSFRSPAARLVMLIATVLVLAEPAMARQSGFDLPLVLRNSGGQSDTIWFGRDSLATDCVDPLLGEIGIPADSMPGHFGFRFQPEGAAAGCSWEALLRDIRPYPTQGTGNSWMMIFPADTLLYPLTLSWPDLNTHFDDQVRLHGYSFSIDLKWVQELTFAVPPFQNLRIETSPRVNAAPDFSGTPEASNLTHASADFGTFVNPHGVPAEFWVEWGDSPSLALSTLPIPIEPRNDFTPVHDEIVGLDPGSMYYFRFAASNEFGTTYTLPDSFRTIDLDTSGGRGCIFSLAFQTAQYKVRRWMGLFETATYCADDALGEWILPPLPPLGLADIRFVDPRGYSGSCFDLGLYRDYRPLTSPSQADTFMVQIQAGDAGYPIKVSWPDLNPLFGGSAVLSDAFGGIVFSVDMKSTTSCLISHPGITRVVIILSQPVDAPPPTASVDTVMYGAGGTALMKALVSPNGFATTTWFEFGVTDVYGEATDTVAIQPGALFGSVLGIVSGLLPNQRYHYRIVANNANGTFHGADGEFFTVTTGVNDPAPLPSEFTLSQNYPNPFNPSTTIRFLTPSAGFVSLRVFDLLGREVATLVEDHVGPGEHFVEWNAGDQPAGVYYCRMVTARGAVTRKMVLMR